MKECKDIFADPDLVEIQESRNELSFLVEGQKVRGYYKSSKYSGHLIRTTRRADYEIEAEILLDETIYIGTNDVPVKDKIVITSDGIRTHGPNYYSVKLDRR